MEEDFDPFGDTIKENETSPNVSDSGTVKKEFAESIEPEERELEVIEDVDDVQATIDRVSKEYEERLEKEDSVDHFVMNGDTDDEYFNNRFLEGVDNAKVGATFSPDVASAADEHVSPVIRAEGIQLPDGVLLDTGEGAQEVKEVDSEKFVIDRDDPNSLDYAVCVNTNCNLRSTCLRYRKNQQRTNKVIFFPEECVELGIYQKISDDMGGYDSMEILEPNTTPSF